MDLPVMPPVQPVLAKSVKGIPDPAKFDGGLSFEPKWDGFRAIVFRDGDEVEITSRNTKPLTRYFPEVVTAIREQLPERCVLDGELFVALGPRLEFKTLQERIHPAASRINLLAEQTPASFVAFDALALGDDDLSGLPFRERRARLEEALAGLALDGIAGRVHLTRTTLDPAEAEEWFEQFEGAGLDGVVAKPMAARYQQNARTMLKIKHARTADVVLAGYRERGILRRLNATPVGAGRLLGAQLTVNITIALLATAGILVVGYAAFGVALPKQPAGFLLTLFLTAAAMLTLGLLVASLASTGRVAGAVGTMLFLPLMFFAGLWIPRDLMPAALLRISDDTPLGACVAALQRTMLGQWPSASGLAILAGYAVVFGAVAWRFFRWE